MSLIINHNCGFFSCCSVRLETIVHYFNTHKCLPEHVDSSSQFGWYKTNVSSDLTNEYFKNYVDISSFEFTHPVNYFEVLQYRPYNTLQQIGDIQQFVTKYFLPSDEVMSMILEMERKYSLDYDNLCVLFYRGNDKITETPLSSYSDYIRHGRVLLLKNPKTCFLIQSDETEFIKTMLREFPGSFFLKDEVRHMKRCRNTVDKKMRHDILRFSKLYLAITVIMSKAKFIICGTGNCSIWIVLYRGHADGVFQFNKNRWITVP